MKTLCLLMTIFLIGCDSRNGDDQKQETSNSNLLSQNGFVLRNGEVAIDVVELQPLENRYFQLKVPDGGKIEIWLWVKEGPELTEKYNHTGRLVLVFDDIEKSLIVGTTYKAGQVVTVPPSGILPCKIENQLDDKVTILLSYVPS